MSMLRSAPGTRSAEFRYTHSGEGFDITAGLFGFYQTVRTQGTQRLGSAASRWLLNPGNIAATYLTTPAACVTVTTRACNPATLNGLTSANDIHLDNLSVAFFTQLAGHVTDRLTIQPGLRVNYDRKKGYYNATVTDQAGAPVGFSAGNSNTRNDQLSQMAPELFEPRFSAWNVSFDLTARYDVTSDVHVYATYARTFKTGGINLNAFPPPPTARRCWSTPRPSRSGSTTMKAGSRPSSSTGRSRSTWRRS